MQNAHATLRWFGILCLSLFAGALTSCRNAPPDLADEHDSAQSAVETDQSLDMLALTSGTDSVVTIVSGGRAICSGVLVGATQVVTPAQCVYAEAPSSFKVGKPGGPLVRVLEARLHHAADLAVLDLKSRPAGVVVASLAKSRPTAGSELSIRGIAATGPARCTMPKGSPVVMNQASLQGAVGSYTFLDGRIEWTVRKGLRIEGSIGGSCGGNVGAGIFSGRKLIGLASSTTGTTTYAVDLAALRKWVLN